MGVSMNAETMKSMEEPKSYIERIASAGAIVAGMAGILAWIKNNRVKTLYLTGCLIMFGSVFQLLGYMDGFADKVTMPPGSATVPPTAAICLFLTGFDFMVIASLFRHPRKFGL